jgi:protein-S-isoprenylcysteine O-methyltransferase Ste14
MNIALTRSETGYRVEFQRSHADAPPRDLGELTSKIVIVSLFSFMAVAFAQDTARTGHVTGLLLIVSEALVVVLTVIRRSAATVDRTLRARLLTLLAFGTLLVRPDAAAALDSESITIAISAAGTILVVLGKLSLGRSFGFTPANRGIVCRGVYSWVRHPIYLGYLITHAGFLIANPSVWNAVVLIAADTALMFRAMCEERTLAQDNAYRSYMQRVRWRVMPGLF